MNLRLLCLSVVTLAAGAALYAFQDEMQVPAPSAEHKALHRTVGTWDAQVDMGAGEPSKGTMVVELGPGGFTVLSRFSADMGGMAFEGRGIDGYDPLKKKYVSVWVDSWTVAPMNTEGTWDEKAQTTTMYGDIQDMTGKMVKHTLVTKWTGNDQMDFAISAPPGADGKEATMLKIKYTRKK